MFRMKSSIYNGSLAYARRGSALTTCKFNKLFSYRKMSLDNK